MATPPPNTGMLTDLEITGFRAFTHLKIERLGHVNLIVGKNNVGKSTLLEALRLYATPDPIPALLELVQSRDEHQVTPDDSTDARERLSSSALLSLFNGRAAVEEIHRSIRIGPSSGAMLTISLNWIYEAPENTRVEDTLRSRMLIPQLEFNRGLVTHAIRLDRELSSLRRKAFFPESPNPEPPCVLVPASGFRGSDMARMWDRIVLSEWEDEVLAALRMLAPQIERLSFVGDERRERSARAKVEGASSPVPFRSLGDGINRLMGLLLALVDAKSGLLLVDEIENGIHYGALTDIWRALIRLALRLNVQIVATTHSWDCVTAFQRATLENTDADGVLTRLEQTESGFRAVQFDEEELDIAAANRIEVR